MTSKTSLNNPMHGFFATWRYALYKTRGTAFLYIGMLALLLPVLFTLICSGIHLSMRDYAYTFGSAWDANDLQDLTVSMQISFMVLVSVFAKILTTVFTIALSVQLFGFMHKKRSVDTFHALPVRRVPMLLGNMAAALSILMVPMIVAFLACGIIAGFHQALPFEFWIEFLLPLMGDTLLGMLACFAFVLFMLVASGTVMDAVVSALILSVAYPVLYVLVQAFLNLTVQGYAAVLDATPITALSPFAAYFSSFLWLIFGMETSDANTLVMSTPWGFTLWWFFFSVLLLVGAVWLYRRRKSERAESTYAFSGVKETMKFLISAACAFALGFIAMLIYQTEFVFILFALLGGFAANTAVEALYSRGLRRFGRGCITYGAFAVAFLVFYTVCVFGAFGYGTTAPAAKDISYITVDFPYYYYSAAENKDGDEVVFMDHFRSEYSDVYLRTQDGRYISNLTDAYETQEDIETVLYLQKVLSRDVLQPPYGVSDQQDTLTMTIEYHLFNGGTVTRQYRIPRDLASGFDEENLVSYTIAEQCVIETVQELRSRGVRGQLLDQLLEKGTLAEWNMNYDAYEHAEELEALEKLWGAAYDEELKALQEKYGERLYATTNYECYSERDGAKTAALMEILRTAPVSGLEGNYVTGHMYLEFTLPAEEVDSRYVKMLTKGHENAVLRLSFSTNFSYADEELVEFIMEYGYKY